MLEYTLIKQHQPRFNVRLRDDKSYPFLAVTVDDEWPRPDGDAGPQAQGRPLLRALRPRLRHPGDARPAAAHLPAAHLLATTSSTSHQRLGRPCLLFHIEKCSGPCVGEVDQGGVRPATSRSCSSSSTATPTRSSSGSRRRMHEAADELEFERAARLRDRLTSVQQGDREAADGGRAHRGLRRASASPTTSSRPPSRCSSCARAGSSAARASSSTRSRTSRPASWSSSVLEGLYDEPAAGRPEDGARARSTPDDPTLYEEWLVASCGARKVDDPGAAAGRQARRCRRRSPATPRRSSSATGCARAVRPQQPGPGAQRAAGRTSACPRPRCASSATT